MSYNQITHEIIGAAIEVHRLPGPGLLESAYEECLCRELTLRKLNFLRQVPVPVVYKDLKLECGYRLEVVVEKTVVLELKAIEAFAPVHEAIMLTYLRLSGHPVGLLINFNVSILKDGVRRFINLPPEERKELHRDHGAHRGHREEEERNARKEN
jgi:GxxExxY protein